MRCQHCNGKIEDLPGFHAICPFCSFDLHSCKNCRYYSSGKPHSCAIIDIEPVIDKEKFNFCEEFHFKDDAAQKEESHKAKKIFPDYQPPKRDFNSLFDDET